MSFVELFLLAVGLSMDAFAVAVCIGLAIKQTPIKSLFIVGLYFGFFQAAMPLLGFGVIRLLSFVAADFVLTIAAYSYWIAFFVLCFLGGKMIVGSFKKEENPDTCEQLGKKKTSLSPAFMLPLAVATSIDALAVGVSFAFLHVNIVLAILLIGVTTFAISAAGVKIGCVFGSRYKSKAEIAGGLILILIGLKILLENFFG